MKQLSSDLKQGIAARVATLATCWRVERNDGVVFGFTSHREDLVWPGEPEVIYRAKGGYTPSAVETDSSFAVDNMELEGILRDAGITDQDVREGLYDYAEVLVFKMDYKVPSNGRLIIKRGNVGEFTLRDGVYVTEIRGLAQRLSRTFMRLVTPDCDAQLFDHRCRAVRDGWYNTGTVTGGDGRSVIEFTLAGTERVAGFFNDGLVSFTSGFGNGRFREIKAHTKSGDLHRVTLFDATAWTVGVDDTIEIEAGCDKKWETCKSRFNNLLNFRGFPKVPGTDKLLQYPDYAGGGGGGGGGKG
ncbi:DUF2163 domain-containing protein [Sinorhizobium fredii]|uniref:DUF2163 domain-containing protein n=1 Tax=Rhizobium fredii TaxID=380 RepID=UPI001294CB04|nr:DUF2163 domain-containing protein [Sinorhizobium fredii]MQW94056.1 DUF2163 domain-containing protein [Sinorhizobium fredii]